MAEHDPEQGRLPSAAELHANLGAALFNQGRVAEAIPPFREAVRRG